MGVNGVLNTMRWLWWGKGINGSMKANKKRNPERCYALSFSKPFNCCFADVVAASIFRSNAL